MTTPEHELESTISGPTSRRAFLLGAAGLTGVAVASATWAAPVSAQEPSAGPQAEPPSEEAAASTTSARTTYVSGATALQFAHGPVLRVFSADGGNAVGEVVENATESTPAVRKKHISGVKYEDITLQFGTGMGKDFYDWIARAFEAQAEPRAGKVIYADYNHVERSVREFSNALLTEVSLPALDASSKDALKMSVTLSPEQTKRGAGSGQKLNITPSSKSPSSALMVSNFRLQIDGLEDACKYVNKVEALTIKQTSVENPIGDVRGGKEVSSVELPNLVVTFAEAHGKSVFAWHEDFVINGNNGDDKEKTGTLEYLRSDKTAVFTITFKGLGIFNLATEPAPSGSNSIQRLQAHMYCEDMDFSYDTTATA